MAIIRIPTWVLALGPATAALLHNLFTEVMDDLPMPQAELAERLGVDQSTVGRWAKGRSAPNTETMQKAIEEVRSYLESLDKRASVAEEVLRLVKAVEEAHEAEGLHGGQDETTKLKKLLEGLKG